MTQYEIDALARLAEISSNVAQLGAWVAVAAFAGSFCAGLLIVQIILRAKDSKNVW
ncbi:MAG: hypothetical protein AAGG01_00875 [Planctomycetota bacterium]